MRSRITSSHWPWWAGGSLALLLIATLTLLPIVSMLSEAESVQWRRALNDVYTQRIIKFSLYQASLSTILALGLALPIALALAHTPVFRGRDLVVNLFSLSLVIPTIIAIYGIVAVYGRTGWANQLLEISGFEPLTFYGLNGILIAHVFFNMPLAARVFLLSLESIPDTQWRLARQLGMSPVSIWRFMEWPTLRSQVPALALLIFTLCFTSFAIVMTLGGGPRATSIEVAIYQSLRFDFDIQLAVTLACIQLTICLALTALSTLFKPDKAIGFQGLGAFKQAIQSLTTRSSHIAIWENGWHTLINKIIIMLACLFVLSPMVALMISAINTSSLAVLLNTSTLIAILNTGIAAISSAIISMTLAFGLLISARHLRIRLGIERAGQWLQLTGNMILIVPPVVLGTGLFLLLRPYADVFSLALLLVILINSLMALPFVLRILDAPVMRVAARDDKLARSLGLQGFSRWLTIDWPQLRQPIAMAFAFAATLSAGDLSAIALFGSEKVTTLPLLLYQRMGSYRLDEAATTAGILLVFCLVLFLGLQRLSGGKSYAVTQ